MDYYPEQRYMLESATIRREEVLPDNAIGRVEVSEETVVNLRDIVVRGLIPSRYLVIEAADKLRLRQVEALPEYMQVELDIPVEKGDVLASDGKKRGRQVLAPEKGVVAYVGEGRIILQVTPDEIEIEAGVDGKVVKVLPRRGVVVETFGALLQGVWGNNRRVVGTLRMEPNGGITSIDSTDLDLTYRGAILVTSTPLYDVSLLKLLEQGVNGVIAPSMDAALLEAALATRKAILLTEGFGAIKMAAAALRLLATFNGKPATLDAVQPDRWTTRRPEVLINPTSRSVVRPPRPNTNTKLQIGTAVRMTRLPHTGLIGSVANLPKMPILLENGLRALCAEVELPSGEKVMIPLANLEVFGR